MKKQVNKILCCLLLVFACLLTTFINYDVESVYAINNATEYTNVLYDLKTDDDFKVTDYPYNKNDYSLKVIQIAESVNDELFIYVYQPCSPNIDLQATSINISKGIDENLSYSNYKLKLVNFSGVFYKYKVDNFQLETTETRYYDISSIYRKWNSQYDEPAGNDNAISEVAFAVDKQFMVYTVDDEIKYYCRQTETIEIIDKFVGYVRYKDNTAPSWINKNSCDRHFVAFSTNKPMDRLIEADVFFTTQYQKKVQQPSTTMQYGNIEETYAFLTDKQIEYVDNENHVFWGGYSYKWERIQTVDEFIESVNINNTYSNSILNVSTEYKINSETRQSLENKEWVLSFYVSDYTYHISMTEPPIETTERTAVGDVSILRLKFETDGVIYNLGVIDNKQTGSPEPINTFDRKVTLTDNFKNILMLLFFIILLIICAPILPYIFKFIFWLVKGIWQVITAPFKAIKMSKKKRKKGGGKK